MLNRSRVARALILLLLGVAAAPLALAAGVHRVGPIYDGPELDYQPSILRVEPGGQLMVVFERIRLADFYGDLYVAFSDDNGQSWTVPQPAVADPNLNERHPSLLQLGPEAFALVYLTNEDGYRLHRATSSDGLTWTPDPSYIDLGWPSSGQINPCVIREADGSLTMTYHLYGGPSYLARSADGGATWDQLRTQVSPSSAPLPRLAKRESDGLYIISYQVNPGSNNLDIYAKVSTDPYDWSGPHTPISTDANSHDSQPIVLEDGTLLVAYAKTPVTYFDIFYRTSRDGLAWSDEVQVTNDALHYDTQPHPLLHGIRGRLLLTWPHQEGDTPYIDHDVWIHTDLLVRPNLGGSRKTVDPAVVAAGEALTYTLLLSNQALTTTAALSDSVPLSTTYQAGSLWASSGAAGYDSAMRLITWTGVISVEEAITLTYRVDTDATLGDGALITSSAQVTDGYGTGVGLAATATVDALPPSSSILDPTEGQFISGTSYLLGGVATDTVSGIGLVQVRVDGGVWHAASGGESWTYLWNALPEGLHTLHSRATDGVGHIETPGPGVPVTVDTTPPALLAVHPPHGALDVPVTATLVLTFSEPVLTGTLTYALSPDPGGWRVDWTPDATKARLSHAALDGGQAYTMTVTGARDLARNALPPGAWTFVTAQDQSAIYLPVVMRAR